MQPVVKRLMFVNATVQTTNFASNRLVSSIYLNGFLMVGTWAGESQCFRSSPQPDKGEELTLFQVNALPKEL